MAKSTNKKRKVIVESNGEAHINASFNNIIIVMSNTNEEVRSSEIDDTTSPLKPGKIFRKVTGASLIAGFILLFVSFNVM